MSLPSHPPSCMVMLHLLVLPNFRWNPKMTHKVNSHPSPHGGTGLFVDSKIAPGQLVLDIREPLVTVPDDAHLKECCSRCMAWKPEDGVSSRSMLNLYHDENPLSFCTGCKVVKYCSKVCLRKLFYPLFFPRKYS